MSHLYFRVCLNSCQWFVTASLCKGQTFKKMHGFPDRMRLAHLCVSTIGCWGMPLARRMWAGTALIYFLPLCEGGHKVTNSKITAQVEQNDGLVPGFMQVTIWCCDSSESPLACPRGPWFLVSKALGQFVTSHSWLLVLEHYKKKHHATYPGQLRNLKFKAIIKGKHMRKRRYAVCPLTLILIFVQNPLIVRIQHNPDWAKLSDLLYKQVSALFLWFVKRNFF